MRAIDPEASGEYVLQCDRDLPPSEQTIWEYRNLNHEEQALLKDLAGAPGTQIDTACHLGLTGAKNFHLGGVPIEWKRDPNKPPIIGKKKPWLNVLNYIPIKERDELAARIIKGVEVKEAEAKNS